MIINELCGRNVLCKQGEYGAEISFDYTEWVNEFGSGSVGWAFQRSHDSSAYLLPDVEADGVSTVTLTETESQYSGQARLEVFFVNDGQTEKRISRTFDFMIVPSLQNLGDVPTEWQSYIDAVHQYATDAENAKEANENMSATASVDNNYGVPSVTVTKSTVSDHVNLDFAFVNLRGNGITSMEEVERIGLVVRYRIVFEDGMEYEFDVTDGNGIASAVLNADYTLALTFTNGTSYTTPSIRGAQGEQGIQGIQGEKGDKGDTGATGATGATGNGIQDVYLTGTSGNVDTYTILFTDGTTTEFQITNGNVSSVNGATGAVDLEALLGLSIVDGKLNITYEV